MKQSIVHALCLLLLAIGVSSCHTSAPRLNYQSLARASLKLGMDIERTDNHQLYIQAAEWIGTPYRAGGTSKRGTDCSGLVAQLYKKVYHIYVCHAALPANWKKAGKCHDAICARATLYFSPVAPRAKKWLM